MDCFSPVVSFVFCLIVPIDLVFGVLSFFSIFCASRCIVLPSPTSPIQPLRSPFSISAYVYMQCYCFRLASGSVSVSDSVSYRIAFAPLPGRLRLPLDSAIDSKYACILILSSHSTSVLQYSELLSMFCNCTCIYSHYPSRLASCISRRHVPHVFPQHLYCDRLQSYLILISFFVSFFLAPIFIRTC